MVSWVIKKDKINGLNKAAKTIISFEIAWNAVLLPGLIVIAIYKFINPITNVSGNVYPEFITMYLKSVLIWISITYILNLIFIAVNFFRLHIGKDVKCWPFSRR